MSCGILMDTRSLAQSKIDLLKSRVQTLKTKPRLAIIRIGDDAASKKYVANKVRRCEEVGILSEVILFPDDVTQREVEVAISQLNKDDSVHGILLQLPIPKHLQEYYLTNLIAPEKDVDGFTNVNAGRLATGGDGLTPCTPNGIITILKEFKIDLNRKDVLIINRSNIVGLPLVHMLLGFNATVTVAHSYTQNLKEKIKSSDIVITAVGIPAFLNADDFSDNTTIIDVAINFDENGKMCGDVNKKDYNALIEKGCNITPVPNGVGQMTVVELLCQTVIMAGRKENGIPY